MKKVYVAGRYSGTNVIEILSNMRQGIKYSCEIMRMGFAPFVPWLDFQLGLHEKFDVETYKDVSIEWLRASDCMFLVPKQERSAGVKAEIVIAEEMGIPIFTSMYDLIAWGESHQKGNA
jgi:hypothetical protein